MVCVSVLCILFSGYVNMFGCCFELLATRGKANVWQKRWGHLWWFAVIVCDWILTIHTETPESNEYNFDVNTRRHQCLSLFLRCAQFIIIHGKHKQQRTPIVVDEYVNYHLQMNTFNWEFGIVWKIHQKWETCTQITPRLCDSKVLFQQSVGIKFHFSIQLYTTFPSTTTLAHELEQAKHTTGNAFILNVIFGGAVVLFKFFVYTFAVMTTNTNEIAAVSERMEGDWEREKMSLTIKSKVYLPCVLHLREHHHTQKTMQALLSILLSSVCFFHYSEISLPNHIVHINTHNFFSSEFLFP